MVLTGAKVTDGGGLIGVVFVVVSNAAIVVVVVNVGWVAGGSVGNGSVGHR